MQTKPRVLTKKEDMFKWCVEPNRDKVRKWRWYLYILTTAFLFLIFIEINAINEVLSLYFLVVIPIAIFLIRLFENHEEKIYQYNNIMAYLCIRAFPCSRQLYKRRIFGKEAFEKIKPIFKKEYVTLKEVESASQQSKRDVEIFMMALISAEIVSPTSDPKRFKVHVRKPEEILYRLKYRICSRNGWNRHFGVLFIIVLPALLVIFILLLVFIFFL